MNLSVPKILLLLFILTMVGVASGLNESKKENLSENLSGTVLNVNESGTQQTAEPLIQALGADDINTRTEARFALEKMGEKAVDPLVDVIDSGTPEVKCEVALALGNIGGQKAEKAIIKLLKDENPNR